MEALAGGAAMSAVNLAEVLTKLEDQGQTVETSLELLEAEGILPGNMEVHALGVPEAASAASLRAPTRHAGLSLGDRACLALGRTLGVPVLTADRSWVGLRTGVKIVCIR